MACAIRVGRWHQAAACLQRANQHFNENKRMCMDLDRSSSKQQQQQKQAAVVVVAAAAAIYPGSAWFIKKKSVTDAPVFYTFYSSVFYFTLIRSKCSSFIYAFFFSYYLFYFYNSISHSLNSFNYNQ